jgi:hypothetical protein
LHDNNTTNWTQQEFDTTIPVITYNHDEAGHLINTHTENYQLPFGYGKINSDEGTTAATATYDELTLTSDEWLTAKATKDTITYYHDFTGVEDSENKSDMNNPVKDTIQLYTPKVDDKGHVVGENITTVTLPFGLKIENQNEVKYNITKWNYEHTDKDLKYYNACISTQWNLLKNNYPILNIRQLFMYKYKI